MPASAIVLAHGAEPFLERCVRALSDDPAVAEVVVVDNQAAPGPVEAVGVLPRVRVLTPGSNLGFAGGCDYAAEHADGDVLVFVNSDAIVQPGAVAALAGVWQTRGRARGSDRLSGRQSRRCSTPPGTRCTSSCSRGSDGLGEPAPPIDAPAPEVASVTGVAFAVRREVWDELGGFDAQYFAYCEDVDLSMRAWQAGYRVVVDPSAVVWHHYDYARTPTKHYLLERNRLINLMTLPERRTRRLVAAPALAVEAGVLFVAVRDGWWRDKLAGWRWLAQHRGQLAERRRRVEAARRVRDRELAPRLLRGALDPPAGRRRRGVPAVVSRPGGYWGWAVGRL